MEFRVSHALSPRMKFVGSIHARQTGVNQFSTMETDLGSEKGWRQQGAALHDHLKYYRHNLEHDCNKAKYFSVLLLYM